VVDHYNFDGICSFHSQSTLLPEDGCSRFFQIAGNNLPDYTASHPRRQLFSLLLLWEPQISHIVCFQLQQHSMLQSMKDNLNSQSQVILYPNLPIFYRRFNYSFFSSPLKTYFGWILGYLTMPYQLKLLFNTEW
jgi:hypothetical protein